jgi:hypothetical protein
MFCWNCGTERIHRQQRTLAIWPEDYLRTRTGEGSELKNARVHCVEAGGGENHYRHTQRLKLLYDGLLAGGAGDHQIGLQANDRLATDG